MKGGRIATAGKRSRRQSQSSTGPAPNGWRKAHKRKKPDSRKDGTKQPTEGAEMTAADVLLVALIGAIVAIPFLTMWAIRSLQKAEDEAQKWRIGHE
jgi:hypothetical protein